MQPPFVMDKWIVGMQKNQTVDYIVNYEVSQFSCKHRKSACQLTEMQMLKSRQSQKICVTNTKHFSPQISSYPLLTWRFRMMWSHQSRPNTPCWWRGVKVADKTRSRLWSWSLKHQLATSGTSRTGLTVVKLDFQCWCLCWSKECNVFIKAGQIKFLLFNSQKM